jgi:hypothetical protein
MSTALERIKSQQKEIALGGRSLLNNTGLGLSRAGMFLGLSKHATAIQRIVDDLAHCRSLGIDVHSVARFQVSNDAFCSYLESDAIEL